MTGKVWIDNQLVANQWEWDYVPQQTDWPVHNGCINLEAGKSYSLKVEYKAMSPGQSHIQLKWQSVNYYQEMEVVPQSQLSQQAGVTRRPLLATFWRPAGFASSLTRRGMRALFRPVASSACWCWLKIAKQRKKRWLRLHLTLLKTDKDKLPARKATSLPRKRLARHRMTMLEEPIERR